jgi:ElaB/YqjD/DUF883 family membrane-anchored ribosome-binding protein
MENAEQSNDIRDRLVEDLKLVVQDAEDLIRTTGKQASESYKQARTRLESTLSSARNGLATAEQQIRESTREAVETADQFVRENPWQAIGAGALAGLLAGLLIGRR